MLMTLFKHEMRATSKIFLWLYIAFAALATVNILLNLNAFGMGPDSYGSRYHMETTGLNIAQSIVWILYVLAILAIVIITFIVIILRFFRNMLGDEGYLMMTLPVSREQLILSKLLAAVVWLVGTSVLIFLTFTLLFEGMIYAGAGLQHFIIEGLKAGAEAGYPVWLWVVLSIVTLLIGCFESVLMLYAAMAIGPNLIKNRVGGSILAFIIIYIASYIISTVVMAGILISAGEETLFDLLFGYSIGGYDSGSGQEDFISIINAVFLSSIICYAAVAVVCWFLTRYMLKKKLNLA